MFRGDFTSVRREYNARTTPRDIISVSQCLGLSVTVWEMQMFAATQIFSPPLQKKKSRQKNIHTKIKTQIRKYCTTKKGSEVRLDRSDPDGLHNT